MYETAYNYNVEGDSLFAGRPFWERSLKGENTFEEKDQNRELPYCNGSFWPEYFI